MTTATAWRCAHCGALPVTTRRAHAHWCSYGTTSPDVVRSIAAVVTRPRPEPCPTCGSINAWHAPHCREGAESFHRHPVATAP